MEAQFEVKTHLRTNELRVAVAKGLDEALVQAAALTQREIQLSMRTGGTIGKGPGKRKVGGIYYNAMRKQYVFSSAPGTPPFVQTGNLRNQIKYERTARGSYIVGVGTLAAYGKAHEFGLGNMPRRPFVVPGLRNAIPKFSAILKNIKISIPRGNA